MGSAFSASTADVSLAPSRKAAAAWARQNQASDDTDKDGEPSHIPLVLMRMAGLDRTGGQMIGIASPSSENVPAVPTSFIQARAPPAA
jgi:hypothetical protein